LTGWPRPQGRGGLIDEIKARLTWTIK